MPVAQMQGRGYVRRLSLKQDGVLRPLRAYANDAV